MLKIVVDSGCDLNSVILESGFDFEQVSLSLNIDDKSFIDSTDLNIEEYLTAMENSPNIPKSAAPSPEAYANAFEGYDEVYCVTISSVLSGSYNSACVGRDLYLEKNPNAKVYVIDSKLSTAAETAVVCNLIEQLKLGFRQEELIDVMSDIITNTLCYFIMESFQNMTKTGRMNPMIAKIANVMNIKPVCKGQNHEMTLEFKPRGAKKAYQKLVEVVSADKRLTEKSTVYITHIQSLESANSLKNMILEKIKVKDIIINECTGLCATYVERFGIVVAY